MPLTLYFCLQSLFAFDQLKADGFSLLLYILQLSFLIIDGMYTVICAPMGRWSDLGSLCIMNMYFMLQ